MPQCLIAMDLILPTSYILLWIKGQYGYSISSNDAMREDFLIKEGKGWRPPRVNETCCSRPQLASLLDDVALSGPAALYETKKADVRLQLKLLNLHWSRNTL